jgi:integrase/recombinase XerC
MPLLKLDRLCEGLEKSDWAGFLRDWDRTLRAGNHPLQLPSCAAQLAKYLAAESPDPDADDAAQDPSLVTKAHIESFQAWMIETRSASTALNKHKSLQQFFKYLREEEEIGRSPMERVKQPQTPQKLVPIMGDDDTKKLLDSTKGKTFMALRDEALIRLYYTPVPGCRRSGICC